MAGVVCSSCNSYFSIDTANCPGCGSGIILNGGEKNVIDQLNPNCLIHRYDGSDLLEPAVVLKSGKTNYKVAIKLQDYAKPITVPKHKVYLFDNHLLSSVQTLRSERTSSMMRFEQQIASHWNHLQPFVPTS